MRLLRVFEADNLEYVLHLMQSTQEEIEIIVLYHILLI